MPILKVLLHVVLQARCSVSKVLLYMARRVPGKWTKIKQLMQLVKYILYIPPRKIRTFHQGEQKANQSHGPPKSLLPNAKPACTYHTRGRERENYSIYAYVLAKIIVMVLIAMELQASK